MIYDPTKFMTDKDIRVDQTIMLMPDDYKSGAEKYHTGQMKSLKSSLHVILLHAAGDTLQGRLKIDACLVL